MAYDVLGDFLEQSNAIEREYSREALDDSFVAWKYAVGSYGDFGIDYVCGIHERLLGRLNPNIAGRLRRKNVYIVGRRGNGERVVVREIKARGNKPRLRKWCEKYNGVESLEDIKEAHIDFEMIHPFLDGNGRVGRILYNVQRVGLGLDVEIFWEKDKADYYKWFGERQRKDDLIRFFLDKKN